MTQRLHNWADNYTYSTTRLHRPETVEQLQELVRGASKIKVLGSRHSFNHVADSTEDLVSLELFNRVVSLDRERHTVTVEAGVRYGQLCEQLHQAGYALHNLASLPHISVAGACATATHGSGDRNRSLASAIAAMEIVKADGELVTLSREADGERFKGAVVSLGGLGAITKVTLDLQPTFEVQQFVYDDLPVAQLETNFDAIESSGYSVSLFTDWSGKTVSQVWLKRAVEGDAPVEGEPTLFGANLAPTHRHPITAMSPVNCTPQMGIPGPWYERLPHFRMDFTPSSGEELQSEYLVPRQHALAAFRVIDGLRERVTPLLQISEIRAIAADDLWMSPFYRQDCIALHFTWKKDWDGVKQVLPLIEEGLTPYEARPHWGKLFTMSPERIATLYAKLPEFQALLESFDPQGKFRNPFVDAYIFGGR